MRYDILGGISYKWGISPLENIVNRKGEFAIMNTYNTTSKILDSCPYCKGKAKIKKATTKFCNDDVHQYYVQCSDCGASTDAFNTCFGYMQQGFKSHVLTEKEAVEHAINNWNNHVFSTRTRLSHMSNKEKVIWQIEDLLSIVVYGAMYPIDSPEYILGWKIRKIAESKELLQLQKEISCDLGEVSKKLFSDRQVRNIVFEYLEKKNRLNFDLDEIKEWSGYFNQFLDGEEDLKPSIRSRILELMEKI